MKKELRKEYKHLEVAKKLLKLNNMKTENIFKIKDLPKDFNLVGCKLVKENKIIRSGWNKGFWLEAEKNSSQMIPIFFKDFNEIKNWEIEVPLFKLGNLLITKS